jgi:hypothetical protein
VLSLSELLKQDGILNLVFICSVYMTSINTNKLKRSGTTLYATSLRRCEMVWSTPGGPAEPVTVRGSRGTEWITAPQDDVIFLPLHDAGCLARM